MKIDELIAFYHALSPESVANFPEFYSADAYFKDPFNEVHGIAPIQHIFSHMFKQVGEPRFVVTGKIAAKPPARRFRGSDEARSGLTSRAKRRMVPSDTHVQDLECTC